MKKLVKIMMCIGITYTFNIGFILGNEAPLLSKNIPIKTKHTIAFTENKGQVHDQNYNIRPDVLFSGTDHDLVFHLRNNGISYQLNRVDTWKEVEDQSTKEKRKEIASNTIYRLDINWLNANTQAPLLRGRATEGFTNYYLENCPNGALNVKSFEEVTYQNIYAGIDLKWYQKDGHLKYDYIVAAGANYKNIQLQIMGANTIKLNNKGELVIATPLGNIIEQAPLVIQNGKTLIANWIVTNNTVSFNIQNLNPNQVFVIDPAVRAWGTYYGGSGDDFGYSCATDAAGNVYMAGYTRSNSGTVIATSGAHQVVFGGGSTSDAYLVKFNGSGVRQWGTYYGGVGDELARSCAVDVNGNIYMAGKASSISGTIISTVGAHQTLHGGGTDDAFLVKFDNNGVRQWGTYYGGSNNDYANSCVTDATGNVYLTGYTSSSNSTVIATSGAHQVVFGSTGGTTDAFLVKFNSSGVRQWGTYYGGSGVDVGFFCTTDAIGNVYLTGHTDANTGTVIATTGAHQAVNGSSAGNYDAFLVKFNSSGVRQWGTYYGGLDADYGTSCAIDAIGDVYLGGYTSSTNGTVIATVGAHQTTIGSVVYDAFLVKFNSSGVRQWGTYYGGTGVDYGYSCTTDATGNVYLAGGTPSSTGTIIASPGAFQTSNGGGYDAFLVKFNSNGVRLSGTYYGGSGGELAYSCATDAIGNVYLVGGTPSSTGTIIASSGAHQTSNGGGFNDAFLVKFLDCVVPADPLSSTANGCVNSSTLIAISSGATINWYATNTSTTVLGTGTAYITPTLSVGTYTYYAEAYSCVPSLARTAIILTVNANPTITANSGTICSGSSFTISPSGAINYTISGGASIVTPTTSVSYSVTGTNSVGCVSSNTALSFVTVNPLPIVSVNSGAICSGSSFTIAPSGANTYSISSGSSVVTPITNTSYTVTGQDINGCFSNNLAVSFVTVNPLPVIVVPSATICAGATTILTANGANTYTWNTGSNANSISINPTVTTTYTINGTSSAGCLSSSAVTTTVTVGAAPSIFVNSATVCAGNSATLIASGVTSYTWGSGANTNSIIVTPTTNTTYSVSGNLIGCSVGASNIASVTVNALPIINTTSSNSLLCIGQSATLTANGAITYSWNTTATTSIIVVSPTITTNYTVSGSAANGCINNSILTQSVSICTELQKINGDAPFVKVYPNPSKGIFTIDLPITSYVTVFDVLGKIVYTEQFKEGQHTITLSNLNNGLYILKTESNGVIKNFRLIKD